MAGDLPSMTWHSVAGALAPLVDAIYVFRNHAPQMRGLAGALLPQVCWRLSGELRFGRQGSSRPVSPPPAFGLGPSTAALELWSEGSTVAVGCGLFPEGWARLMREPADALALRAFDLAEAWGPPALAPLALDPAASDAELATGCEAALLARLNAAPVAAPDPRVAALSEWARSGGGEVETLAKRLDLSQRQLQRLSLRVAGMPPRRLSNQQRVLRAAAALAAGWVQPGPELWSDWSDQPHFIRSFKTFVGVTPSAFLTEPDLLVREVMLARTAIASSHPMGLNPE